MTALDWSRWPNFSRSEMMCSCGCCRADMDPKFMDMLQACRKEFGAPLVVTSGFRCPEHNAKVGSTGKNGPHTKGKAADVKISGENAFALLDVSFHGFYFSGIGLKQHGPWQGRFIHLDTITEGPRPRVWTYA